MIILLILTISLGVVAFSALFYIGFSSKKRNRKDIKLHDLEHENERLKAQLENISDKSELWREKEKSFENRISDLNQRIIEKEESLKELDNYKKELLDTIENLKNKSYILSIADYALEVHNKKANDERFKLLQDQNDLNEAIQTSKTAAENISRDIKTLSDEINLLKERKRLSILNQNDLKETWWEFSITNNESELISILERIKKDYPELKLDISNIEWKRIWLPKAQDLVNSNGLDRKGIYRLILKNNEEICYVGQAVSIKDRWYQHIKKMIGVEAKGNEKLYNYRPEDFYWTVIEFDSKDLNESEHYWIDFFGCKEKGLNKKV